MGLTQLTTVYSDTPQGSTLLTARLWHFCAEISTEKWADLHAAARDGQLYCTRWHEGKPERCNRSSGVKLDAVMPSD